DKGPVPCCWADAGAIVSRGSVPAPRPAPHVLVREPIMRKSEPAADPDAYVRALTGWRRDCVETLRTAVRKAKGLDERIKWGHIAYFASGPVLLIRAEDERVLFGFWRGKRLREIEPRLKGGGQYEMATLELREGDTVKPAVATKLAKAAVALNETV